MSEQDDFNYEEDQSIKDTSIGTLTRIGHQLLKAMDEEDEAEAEYKRKKEARRELQEKILPEAMELADCESFELGSGFKITLKEKFNVSFSPKEDPVRYRQGLDWLLAQGQEGLIKREVQVPLGRDAGDKVEHIFTLLREAGYTQMKDEQWVESSTLRSFISEMLEGGRNVPVDIFKLHTRKEAEVKAPRVKR